jgi:hypothetical protein
VAILVVSWLASVVVYRAKGSDEIEARMDWGLGKSAENPRAARISASGGFVA